MKSLDLGTVAWSNWRASDANLPDSVVDIVLVPHIASRSTVAALTDLLTPDERTATQRFKTQPLHDRAIISRGVLRLLLSHYASQVPRTLDIATEAGGKPFLRSGGRGGRPVAFNVSHAGDWLFCAFARLPIGVDIEEILPIENLASFLGGALGERERAVYASLPVKQRLAYVYRTWVCKEAIGKRTGEGIGRDFAGFDVDDEQLKTGIALRTFVPAVGHIAAIATSYTEPALRFRRVARLDEFLPSVLR